MVLPGGSCTGFAGGGRPWTGPFVIHIQCSLGGSAGPRTVLLAGPIRSRSLVPRVVGLSGDPRDGQGAKGRLSGRGQQAAARGWAWEQNCHGRRHFDHSPWPAVNLRPACSFFSYTQVPTSTMPPCRPAHPWLPPTEAAPLATYNYAIGRPAGCSKACAGILVTCIPLLGCGGLLLRALREGSGQLRLLLSCSAARFSLYSCGMHSTTDGFGVEP